MEELDQPKKFEDRTDSFMVKMFKMLNDSGRAEVINMFESFPVDDSNKFRKNYRNTFLAIHDDCFRLKKGWQVNPER